MVVEEEKRMRLTARMVLTLGAGALLLGANMAPQAYAASVAHIYELNGSLADSLGGPALSAAGGTLNATNYSFAANQGLSLQNGLTKCRGLLHRNDLSIFSQQWISKDRRL